MNRRTFLKGAGGIMLGLPTLEIMLNNSGALAAGVPLTNRFGMFVCGQSLGADFDALNYTIPSAAGRNFPLSIGLKPIGTYNLQNDISVVSGLKISDVTAPGGRDPDFHADSHYPQITGVRTTESGVGADQIIANIISSNAKFRSLNYQAQPAFYVPGYDFYGRNIMTFVDAGGGNIQGLANEASPQRAYQTLFTNGGASAQVQQELNKKKSILDFLTAQRAKLMSQVGVSDQIRLSQHFDQIRDLEKSIMGGGMCQPFPDPGPDPAIDTAARYSDENKRNRIFMDLIYMAFVCDATRVATHMLTTIQCHMAVTSLNPELAGSAGDQHELGHGAGRAVPPAGTPSVSAVSGLPNGNGINGYSMSLVHAWHIDHFCYLLNRLKNTPEGAGSILDSCALVFMFEGGHGLDQGSGGSHSTENMMMLVAGRAGGLQPGKHIVKTGEHPAKVTISAMKAVGGPTTLGEISGEFSELFTA